METARENQEDGSEGYAADDFGATGPDGENIVINMTTAKKSRHIRSPAQLEALAKAQTARKENAVRRREEKAKPAVPDNSPSQHSVVQEEKKMKDYRALYRAQKRELDELRFERAVHERLREVTAREPREPPSAPAVPAVPAPAPKDQHAVIQDFMNIGWRTAGPVRKKNVTSHW